MPFLFRFAFSIFNYRIDFQNIDRRMTLEKDSKLIGNFKVVKVIGTGTFGKDNWWSVGPCDCLKLNEFLWSWKNIAFKDGSLWNYETDDELIHHKWSFKKLTSLKWQIKICFAFTEGGGTLLLKMVQKNLKTFEKVN